MKRFDVTLNYAALDKAVTVAVGEAGRAKFKETYDLFNTTMLEMFEMGAGNNAKELEDLKVFHKVNVEHERAEADMAGYQRGWKEAVEGFTPVNEDEQASIATAAAALYEDPQEDPGSDWDNPQVLAGYSGVQGDTPRVTRDFDVA